MSSGLTLQTPTHIQMLSSIALLLPVVFPCAQSLMREHAEISHLAAADDVEELITAGRKLFDSGKLDEARAVFEQAQALDKGSVRTRVFVLRVAIAQGQIEEALLEADALKKGGNAGIELDYIYGVGFYAMAARDIAWGQTTAVTGSQFEDAIRSLKLVTEKNDPRFEDAWGVMAEAAWYTQDADTGIRAAERAVELAPLDPWKRLLRGKLALVAFAQWKDDAEKGAAGQVQWLAAVEAFEKALELCGDSKDASTRSAAQQACMQLATTHLWKDQRDEAAGAFARAIALAPDAVDYNAISQSFSGQELVNVLTRGHKEWSAQADANGGATLDWWLGYAQYAVKALPEAAAAFERAHAKNSGLTSSLYYLFRVHFEQRETKKSLANLRAFAALDDRGLVDSLAFDVPGNTARLESFIGWALDEEQHGKPLNDEAIFACELITRIVAREPENSRHWNNLGLFLRDEGDRLRGTQGALVRAPKPFDEAKVNQLWELALEAYEIALELEPKNPNYLNDTAVMLHYYLLRDLGRAKVMYEQGFVEATALLKRTDLTPETRDAVKIALRDTGNNVNLVQKLIDKLAAEAAAKQPPPEKPAGQ